MSTHEKTFDRKEIKKRSMFVEAMNRLLHNKSAVFGLILMLVMILLCAFANVICPKDIISRTFQMHSVHRLANIF